MKYQTPQIIPIPEGQHWLCLQCEMNADRDTEAAVLFVEGDRLSDMNGMCANHAEVLDLADLREAPRRLDEAVGGLDV